MGRIVSGATVKDARIEQILSFTDIKELERYVNIKSTESEKDKFRILYDNNFSSNNLTYARWSEHFTGEAVLIANDEVMIHVSLPYNKRFIDKGTMIHQQTPQGGK